MRDWNLSLGDPLSLTLASDIRLGPTDYLNDQIWELSLKSGTPPALALQTTFGLRARSYRIFPIFRSGDTERSDPNEFSRPPVFNRFFPNYISLSFMPFPDIDVIAEYWVPDSHTISSRFKIINHNKSSHKLKVDWVCQLSPTEGKLMAPIQMQATTILAGYSSGLALVFILTGDRRIGSGAYPSLTLDLELTPEEPYELIWAHAALDNIDNSFAMARQIVSQNWEAIYARIEMVNAGQIEIYTGNPYWDAAFMLSNKVALSLVVTPPLLEKVNTLPFPSLVQNRTPDQGFSLRADGSDYNHLWNGQAPLDVYYLTEIISLAAPEIAEGLLRNYLSTQESNGSIDWKPGIVGQRSRISATPILASLAWRIYEVNQNLDFLKEVYIPLVKFVLSWFTPEHDRDRDGIPEWDNLFQAGFDDHPLYSHWHDWSLGLEISTAESPALCAALYRECQTLLKIARLLSQEEYISTLGFLSMRMRVAVEAAWNKGLTAYLNWDRDTHLSTLFELIGQRIGSGVISSDHTLQYPGRVLLKLQIGEGTRPYPRIYITGTDQAGNKVTEEISKDKYKWHQNFARITDEHIYQSVEQIEIHNLKEDDVLTAYWAGHQYVDYSALLPLWANLSKTEIAQALIENTVLDENIFWRKFGIPACANPPDHPDNLSCSSVHLPWNALIGEGLVYYGYRQAAADLVQRLLSGIIKSLQNENSFRRSYHAVTGQGIGERNALAGLAPVGLFLQVLGVQIYSPYRVALSGVNPFPWPITVKYRGLTIHRQIEKTTLIFPDGQSIEVNDPKPQIITLDIQPVTSDDRLDKISAEI